jgi:polysaccharide export outer membrane protein
VRSDILERLSLLLIFGLVGCASLGMVTDGEVAVVTPSALPAPAVADLVPAGRPHLVGPGDTLSVSVLGLPELSQQVRVDSSGKIDLPLAGSIDVLGQQPETIARAVETRLRANHVREPNVAIGILDIVSQAVTVSGEVRKPGVYPVIGNSTLMRAIARAEGTNDYANNRHVVVFRTVEGRQMAALYDLRAITLGASLDPQVYSNDVVVVGESAARRLFPQLAQMAGLLVTPIVTILANSRN